MPSESTSKPTISVIMPVWNCEQFVAEATRSIIEQTYADFELLAVDGGSTDSTVERIKQFGDKRIRILHAGPGIVAALNIGLNEARGRWIARQDADDISLPERLQKQIETVERCKDTVLCYTDDQLFGEVRPDLWRGRFPRTQSLVALRLCFQCPVMHSSVLMSKEAVDLCGRYRQVQGEDYELWGRLLLAGKTIGLPAKLLMTRRHSLSASQRHAKALSVQAKQTAISHCSRFMNLSAEDAARAYAALNLRGAKEGLAEWRWFLTHCLPHLRWKSAEMYAWVLWQTCKAIV
jgi:glycosyltransferase involved in cell wall biosynthesis